MIHANISSTITTRGLASKNEKKEKVHVTASGNISGIRSEENCTNGIEELSKLQGRGITKKLLSKQT